MKRLISLMLCVAFLFTAFPVMAAEVEAADILLNETFNDAITNSTPGSVTLIGEGSLAQAVMGTNGKKNLRVRNKWESAKVNFALNISSSSSVILESRFMIKDKNSAKNLMQYSNDSENFTILTLKENGDLVDMNQRRVGKVSVGEWVKVSVKLNFKTLRYDLYINDKFVSARGKLTSPGTISKVGFESVANEKTETTLYCDYFRAYTGTTLMPDDYFPTVEMNDNVRKTSVEHATEPKYKTALLFDIDLQNNAPGEYLSAAALHAGEGWVVADETIPENMCYRAVLWDEAATIASLYPRSDGYPSVAVQADLRVNEKNKSSWSVACADNGGNYIDLVTITREGKLLAADGKKVITDKNLQDGWVNVSSIINYKTKEVDYYIDGELALENFYYGNITGEGNTNRLASSVNEIKFYSWDKANEEQYLEFDNLLVYKSFEYMTKDEIRGSNGVSMEDPKNAIDYTLDTTPLNPDMSVFTEIPESISTPQTPAKVITDYSKPKQTYKDCICVVANTSNVWLNNGKYASEYKFIWDGVHITGAASTLAAFANQSFEYDEATQTAKIGKVTAKAGDNFITVDGQKYESDSENKVIDGVLYMPLREFVRYGMNKFYGESVKGFGVIATRERPYHFNTNQGGQMLMTNDDYSMMMAYINLDRLNANALMDLFNKNVKGTPYPRISTIKEDAPKYKAAIETDPFVAEMSGYVMEQANEYLNQTITINAPRGSNITGLPSSSLPDIMYYAYYMTGDRSYIDKVIDNAQKVVDLDYWSQDAHFLSTSAAATYLAYTYDMYRDELTKEQRDAIANALINKAIQPHLDYMYGVITNNKWPFADYNWNSVCNAGPMIASMVLLGEGYNDAILLDCLEKAQVSLGYSLHYFAPDGCGWESPGYNDYTLGSLLNVFESVNNYFGDSLGIISYLGLEGIGRSLAMTTGKANNWMIHCEDTTVPYSTANNMYFTKMFGDYVGQRLNIEQNYKYRGAMKRDALKNMKYYMPNPPAVDYPAELDVLYTSSQLGYSRDAWGAKNQTVMGVHGGYNYDAGLQVDIGYFFFEVNGKIFADDPGIEDYSVSTTAYPCRAEGANVWVVNPDSSYGQNLAGYGDLYMVESKPKGVIYTLDLTSAYANQVESAQRGYMLSEDRKVFTVQDEIKPIEGSNEFYWFWHTRADIDIDEEEKKATLTMDGETVTVYFDSNVDFSISKQDKLTSLPNSPVVPGQLQKAYAQAMHKIVVQFYSEGEPITFRAMAVPYGQTYTRGELTPINDWTISDGSMTEGYANTDMIYVNGEPIPGFEPDRYTYSLYYPNYKSEPVITADTDGVIAEIIPRTDSSDTVAVRIAGKGNPDNIKTYTITLSGTACIGLPENATELSISAATASSDDGNPPRGAIDGSLETRWTSLNEQWITLDLGSTKEFNTLAMMVYGNDKRRQKYDIYVSDDGENFTLVSGGLISAGTLDEWEYTQFKKVSARYIKLECHATLNSPYNSITEFRVYNAVEE